MKHFFMVFTYLVSLINKLLRQNGLKAVVAENLLLKQQLLALARSRKRAHLAPFARCFLGLWSTLLDPCCLKRVAVLLQPSTLLKYHQAMAKKKYRLLYSSPNRKKPDPKRPPRELIELVLEMRRRNPNFG